MSLTMKNSTSSRELGPYNSNALESAKSGFGGIDPKAREMTMRPLKIFVCAPLLALLATGAQAQFTQYTRPGNFEVSPLTIKAQLDDAIENAKWDWGRVRVDPWLALREIAYDSNVDARSRNEESDLTATIGAGLRGYLPVGSDLIVAGHVLPEYVWWRDLSDRRRVNGRYGLGLFGTFGRTALELSATRVNEARFFSREFEDQVNTEDEVAFLSLDVDLDLGFSLFGSARLRRLAFDDEDDPDLANVRTLDRDETVYRAGARYTFDRGLGISLGVEDSEVEFEDENSIRANEGTSPFVRFDYDPPDFYAVVELVNRDLEFLRTDRTLDYDEITGHGRFEWEAFERLGFQTWVRRDLVYSFTDEYAYFEEDVYGLGARASVSSWLGMRVFGETGRNDFTEIDPLTPVRSDDFDTYGIEFQFKVRRATIRLEYSLTDYTSTLPQFDRDVTIIRSGFVFGSPSPSPWG